MSPFDPARHPRKLNLGCGPDRRPGYLNVDLNAFSEPDLVADVRDLAMLPGGYYDEIVAQDVLEHLPRTSTAEALREWNRLLRTDAALHLRVPSLEGLWKMFEVSEDFDTHSALVQNLFGTQAYTGDFHFTTFTRVLLEGYLERAGFTPTEKSLKDGWLFDWTARKTSESGPARDDRLEQLINVASDDQFVRELYAYLLGRDPDAGGFAYYRDNLHRGHFTRQQVVDVVLGSSEYRARNAGTERRRG